MDIVDDGVVDVEDMRELRAQAEHRAQHIWIHCSSHPSPKFENKLNVVVWWNNMVGSYVECATGTDI